MTEPIGRRLFVDLGALTALIVLPILPLFAWRCSPALLPGWHMALFTGAWLSILTVWFLASSRVAPFGDPEAADAVRTRRPVNAAVAVLLFALTVIAFYLPLRVNFWGGADDFANFQPECATVWSNNWDAALGRPLVGLPTFVALLLRPGRIEGFLWVGSFLCFANGWLLYSLLGRLMPRTAFVPIAAAIFLIVNRADPLRFFVMWASNHYTTVAFLLLLASWLFVLSYERQSRGLLVLSCVALAGSLLSNESAYPTAALVPFIALVVRRDRERYAVWTFAWYATVTLLASRLLYHLLNNPGGSYQAEHSKEAFQHPHVLIENLRVLLMPALTYLKPAASWAGYAGYACGAFAVAALAVFAVRRTRAGGDVRVWAIVPAVAAVLCGVLPFLPLKSDSRTQFLVAPAEATLLALLLGAVARALPRRARPAAATVVTGLLAANATVAAIYSQDHHPSPVRFERSVHMLRQVRGLSPSFAPETLLVFVHDDKYRTPVGSNLLVSAVSRQLLGVEAIQANFKDPLKCEATFQPDGVFAYTGWGKRLYPYDQIVAFSLQDDGSVTLLRELPASLLPAPVVATSYDPLRLLRPGPFVEIPYFRYPAWSLRAGDVESPEEGLLLGDGWGPLVADGSDVYRYALDGAEIVVNSQGKAQRELTLELEPLSSRVEGGQTVEARDAAGTLVATASLSGRGVVRLSVPVDPERVSSFRLHVRPALGFATPGPGETRFRAYRRGDAKRFAPLARDIFRDGLCPGLGWHGPEEWGGLVYRFVDADAELDVRFFQGAGTELALLVEPNDTYQRGKRPCTVEVRDDSDHVLATCSFRGRETVHIPASAVGDGRLRLHVRGDGKADEPRLMNYRLFSCAAATP